MRSIRDWLASAADAAEEMRPDGGTHAPQPDRPDANPLGRISSAATAQAAKTISTAKTSEQAKQELLEYFAEVRAKMTAAPYMPSAGIGPLKPAAPMSPPVSIDYDPFNNRVAIQTPAGVVVIPYDVLAELVAGKQEIALKAKKSASVDKRASTALAKEEALEGKVASQASSLSALWEFIEERGLMADAVAWCDERGASATT